MIHPGIELLGKKVLDAVTDGEVHFQAIHALNERFPQAMACTAIMDLTVEAEVFGSQLCMSEHEAPTVTGRLLTSFEEVQDDSFAVILHNCGNTGHCTPAMLKAGAKGYHFGNKADMVEVLKVCPADVLVMGNLDPVGIFKMVSPEVPFANIEAFYQAVERYNNECGR